MALLNSENLNCEATSMFINLILTLAGYKDMQVKQQKSLILVDHVDFKRHCLFCLGADIQEIIQPLLHYGIRYFGYCRYDKDRGLAYLNNMPGISEAVIKQKLYLNAFYAPWDHYVPGIYIGDLIRLEPQFVKLMRDQGLAHGLILVKRNLNNTEIFYFYTGLHLQGMNHFYVNYLDVFEQFTLEFKYKAKDLIHAYEPQRLTFPSGVDHYDLTDPNLMMPLSQAGGQDHDASRRLTPRENHCLVYLKRGYTAKMIAKEFNISNRTVEHHLAHIRQKLDIASIKALLLH